MPHTTSLKKYLQFNVSLLFISLFFCIVIYFIWQLNTQIEPSAGQVDTFSTYPPSIYPLLGFFIINHFVLTLCSYWYLFKRSIVTTDDTIKTSTTERDTTKKNTHSHTNNQTEKDTENTLTHILVVDDNISNATLLKNHLQDQSRHISTANNGLDAIRAVEEKSINIIFMDLEMVDMNGSQTVEHIRVLERKNRQLSTPRIPIIAVSAHAKSHKQLTVLQQGFDDYLEKPVDMTLLNDVMNRWQHVITAPNTKRSTHYLQAIENTIRKPSQQINTQQNAHGKNNIEKVINIDYSLTHSNNNNALARDMLTLLIDMIRKEKALLLAYYNEYQWEKLYQLNHKIYGGSVYCGAPKLQESNQHLERLLQPYFSQQKEEDANIDQDKHEEIKQALNNVIQAIDDILLWNEQYDIDVIFNIE